MELLVWKGIPVQNTTSPSTLTQHHNNRRNLEANRNVNKHVVRRLGKQKFTTYLSVVRRLDLLLAKSPLFLCAVVRRIGTVLKIKKSIVVSTAARNPNIVHWKSTFNAHYINIA